MIHLQWERTASPEGDAVPPVGDAVSPVGDLLASPNFGICDTAQNSLSQAFRYSYFLHLYYSSCQPQNDFLHTMNKIIKESHIRGCWL